MAYCQPQRRAPFVCFSPWERFCLGRYRQRRNPSSARHRPLAIPNSRSRRCRCDIRAPAKAAADSRTALRCRRCTEGHESDALNPSNWWGTSKSDKTHDKFGELSGRVGKWFCTHIGELGFERGINDAALASLLKTVMISRGVPTGAPMPSQLAGGSYKSDFLSCSLCDTALSLACHIHGDNPWPWPVCRNGRRREVHPPTG
jgi:hypothetical protein